MPLNGSRGIPATAAFGVTQTPQATSVNAPDTPPAPSPSLGSSQPTIPQTTPPSRPRPPRGRRRRWIWVVAVLILLAAGAGIFIWRGGFNQQASVLSPDSNANDRFDTLNLSVSDLAKATSLVIDASKTLSINGQLKVNNGVIITPTAQPASAVAGQLYYDQGTNLLNYYNGSGFVSLATNPQTVTSLGGASGELTLGGGLSLTGNQLSNTGILSITSASNNLVLTDDGSGNITLADTSVGGTGNVQTQAGTPGRLAVFSGAQSISDSLLSQSGTRVTVDGDMTIAGSLDLQSGGTSTITLAHTASGVTGQLFNDGNLHISGGSNNVWIDAGGSGTIFLNAANGNPVAINQSTIPTYPLEVNGDINISDVAGSLRIGGTAICTITGCVSSGGGSGVDSLNGLSGALTLANASGAGTTVTINDASTAQKGIAQFNSTNFSASGGVINTIQNIDTAATPTFAGINTNAITPSGALTVGSTAQNLTLQGANTTLTATSGANVASLTFVAPTANVVYRLQTAAAGTYDVCTTAGNCTGVGGGVSTPGGTTNALAKFTGTQTIGDSIISDDGTLVTVTGNLSVTGTLTLGTALSVGNGGTGATTAAGARNNLGAAASGANSDITSLSGLTTALSVVQGGTGATSLTANGVLLGNGTSPISSLVAGGAGECLISTVGAPVWQACPGSGGVTSLNGLTGVLTIANASAAGSTVTLNDASTAQKGIAQFNSTNFSASGGVINTIQNINTTAAPTFGQLTITSSQASAAMLTVNNTNVSATGNLVDLQLNGSSRFAVSPAGALTLSSTVNGQTISSSASFTGTLAVTGAASLNGGASVTGTLTANTITPSAALTVGAVAQSFTLQGNASSTITANDGTNTTALTFQTPTADVNYRFLTAAAGTYDVCTTVGNCAGVGGSVTTAGGTTNTLAKFTGSNAIGDSIITDNGTVVTIGGVLTVNAITPSAAMTIGATGQTLTLQGSTTTITATDSGVTNSLVFATPATSNKTITIPNATGTVAVSASGPLSVDANGNITCPTCVTSGGGSGGVGAVDSLNGLTGALTLANATGSGTTITIDDASTSQKGIAQFNSTNFSVSGGVVNTIQNINTTAAPTFGQLTLTSSQASAAMIVVNNTNVSATGNLLDLQLNGTSRLAVTPAGNMTIAGTINGQAISSTASFTGTLAVAGAASLNGGASVTGTLTANTITPSAALTVGATGQSFLLQGNASSTITATNSGSTTTLAFQTPTANVTYRLLTAAAGTYDICTTVGNCAGVGGSVTTPGGTAGTIAKFTASGVIGDSIITESGSTISVAGTMAATTAVQAPLFDTASAAALNIGTTNATSINLQKSTTITGDLTQSGGVVSLTGNGASSLTTSSGALTITSAASATWSTTSGTLTIQSASANNSIAINGSSNAMTLNTGASGTITVGSSNTTTVNVGALTNNARTVNVGVGTGGSQTQTVNVGSLGGASVLTLQAGTGNINLNSAASTIVKPSTNTTTAFQVQPAASTTPVLNVDTSNTRVGINMNNPGYALDVTGDVNTSTVYRIGGTSICTSSGCTPAAGSGNYIQNTTTQQTANFNILSASASSIGARIEGAANMSEEVLVVRAGSNPTANVFEVQNSSGNQIFAVDSANTRTIVGGGSICTTGRLCIGQTTSTNGGTVTNLQNIQSAVVTATTNFVGQNIVINDTSTAIANTISGVIVDTTGTTNTSATVDSITAKVAASQPGSFLQFQNGASTVLSVTNAGVVTLEGNLLANANVTLGNAATDLLTVNGVLQGASPLVFEGATPDGFETTLAIEDPTDDNIITLPDAGGTVCLQGSSACSFAPTTGGTGYIQNTTSAQSANFYVQAASSGSVGGVIRANAAGSGDILQLKNGAGTNIATFSSIGAALFQNSFDSVSALTVLDAAGTGTLFNVDSSNGRVGVGGASSFSKFEVQGGDAAIYNSGNNPRLILGDSTTAGQNGYLQWDSTNDYFRIESVGTNGLKINDNFVSIGNIFPGEPLTVGSGSTQLFQITSTGTVQAKTTTNSATGFRVQNASDVNQLTVDTSNSRVIVGPSGGNTTGTLLVLGTKTNSGDPTPVAGGMYYNSNSGKFRCYENGNWKNCLGFNANITLLGLNGNGAASTWTNMPAALTEIFVGGGVTNPANRSKFDLTNAEQVRLIVNVEIGGSTNAELRVQYSTDGSTWNYLDAAGTGLGQNLNVFGNYISSWSNIAAGAKADVWLRLVGINGDAAGDPEFGLIQVQAR